VLIVPTTVVLLLVVVLLGLIFFIKTGEILFLEQSIVDGFGVLKNFFSINLNVLVSSFTNILCKLNYSFSTYDVSLLIKSLYIDYLTYPFFLYSGLFFFFTTFMSLLVLSYLGLYGTFILNLVSLTFL
jgi:hypothetical protein